ncbi:Matrixin [Botrimarina colliarenosi]|uniref:Matrixin n=1 Tax=Botrimarina colliarenosi TaxID=2528001 RepID=A0A5C6A8X0_9BACT|nr:matrixin family metalloprotease [Botrimarina colliarenosi]TWT94763.1 Matrixin [Botrimarina colliarenosi]
MHRTDRQFVRPLRLAAVALAIAGSTSAYGFVPAGGTDDASRWQLTAAGTTGQSGDPVRLTWSFVPDGTLVRRPENTANTAPSDFIATFDATFGAGPGGSDLTQRPWFTYFQQAFDRWSALSGVTYTYESHDSTLTHGAGVGLTNIRGDVRIGGIGMDGIGGTLAYNYFATDGGDMAIDTDDLAGLLADSSNNYRGLRNVIMHEAGHGLGLDHSSSGDANFLLEASIDTSFDGPQHDDLRGIHWLYGDVFEKAPAGRNETAALATPLGALQAGSMLAIGTSGSGSAIGPNETDFVSISNESDLDFFSFTVNTPVSLDLSLTPRGASYNQGGTPFNTLTTSDLSLALFASDGVTLLADSASNPAGVVESITDFALTQPGTYYARVRGPVTTAEQVVQFYRLDLAATDLIPALLGDFNADGVVDAGDYTLWRDESGSSVSPYSGADHTGDGQVTAADYSLWQAHYGETLGGGAASVPEPAAAWLLATLAIGCGRLRR